MSNPERQVKDVLHAQVARLGKVMCGPKRLELIELPCQGEKPVEKPVERLAEEAAIPLKLASAHQKALRLAVDLARREGVQVRVYRMGDSVMCAKSGQITPRGVYDIEHMLKPVLGNKGQAPPVARAWKSAGCPLRRWSAACAGTLEDLGDWTP